eukprot:jgi/Ulvmu1/11278/UM073_0050.1
MHVTPSPPLQGRSSANPAGAALPRPTDAQAQELLRRFAADMGGSRGKARGMLRRFAEREGATLEEGAIAQALDKAWEQSVTLTWRTPSATSVQGHGRAAGKKGALQAASFDVLTRLASAAVHTCAQQ